ncbi:MAG: hypothetical protein FD123_4252 [Bacteroidetes bacterium]|nr:MAG: hypothetical protein FD123_4252 [Bacteroidota bacterium]
MKKLSLFALALFLGFTRTDAQSGCTDLNAYVDSKNSAGTGAYTLLNGFEEKAAQTYYYSGPGRVNSVRVYGNYPGITAGVPLRVGVYNVDANGRPTSQIQATNDTWWWFDNFAGYITVNFGGGGVYVNDNFAITVEIRNAPPWGGSFQLQYTGDGEGDGADLASLAGTSTGSNWSSAMTNFSKDGDFYLVPRMTHYITPAFDVNSTCVATNDNVSFTNMSSMTLDSMFNTIGLSGYSGSSEFYSWDFGDGSPVVNTVSPTHTYTTAGVYTVTLTCTIDGWGNDCSESTTAVVSVGLAATATMSTPVTCNGGNNGAITVNATGGASPYEYRLDNMSYQSGNTFIGLTAGTYTVYVQDDLGCETTTSVTVTEPGAINFTTLLSTNSSCGSSNGALLVAASGGTGALQYSINGGPYQSSGQFNNLSSDFYTVTVQDANGCTVTNYTTVNDQGAPVLQVLSHTNISCNGGNDGSIMLLASGGSGTLQYSVNGGANWQTSGTFNNLTAGMYFIMVQDASGCSDGEKYYLSQPPAIQFMSSSTNVSCFNGNDGTITVSSPIGGTGTYSYSLNNINYQSGAAFSGLVAGSYVVYVKDIANCISTDTVSIGQPGALILSASSTNSDCYESFTGSITATANGGTGGYTYSIDGEYYQESNVFSELGAGTYTVTVRDENGCMQTTTVSITQPTEITATITTGSSTCGNANGTLLAVAAGGSGSGYQYSIDGINFSTTNSFSGLPAGTYYIVITDGNGCQSIVRTSINDANGPTITSISHTNVACNNGLDGSITINTVTGGSGTLQYSVNGSTWQTSNMFSGLDAGAYNVLVKDANGCIGDTLITLTEPNGFAILTSTVNVSCHGDLSGSVTINAAGGSGQLAYSLDNGINYQSSNIFNTLSVGNYVVVVRDAAGCTGTATFVITEPTEITASIGTLNVLCHGDAAGAIYVTGTGGTGALQYSLNNVTYQGNGTFTGLTAATYAVFVKDANGCIEIFPAVIAEPIAMAVSYTVSDVTCAGGNNGVIDLTVAGGTHPYSFAWSNDAGSEDIFNLTAGSYTVVVTDGNGCAMTQTFTVNQPANPLIVNGTITNATGQTATDGSVDITITGGSGPYTFLWSNNATTEDLSGVAPGVYTVSITDANGCVTSGTFTVSFNIGIATSSVDNALNLYPNPARDIVTIDAGTMIIGKVEVISLLGQMVYRAEPNSSKIMINTDKFSEDLYLVRLHINGQVVTKRLLIAH